MARIDLVTLRQRLAKQQQQPVSAEPPSWTTRPAPASAALRTTPSAAAPAGTLHATTTMRAAQPSEATNARAERVRANALRAQIDELKGEMAVASAEAEGVLAEERLRADRLSTQVEALSAEVVRAKQQVVGRRPGRIELRQRSPPNRLGPTRSVTGSTACGVRGHRE